MSGTLLVRARDLPDAPLDAAAQFLGELAPQIRGSEARNVVVSFSPADHEHDSWRRAAIEELAREAAPDGRVNALVCEDDGGQAAQAVLDYLAAAPGVTGQVLATRAAKD